MQHPQRQGESKVDDPTEDTRWRDFSDQPVRRFDVQVRISAPVNSLEYVVSLRSSRSQRGQKKCAPPSLARAARPPDERPFRLYASITRVSQEKALATSEPSGPLRLIMLSISPCTEYSVIMSAIGCRELFKSHLLQLERTRSGWLISEGQNAQEWHDTRSAS